MSLSSENHHPSLIKRVTKELQSLNAQPPAGIKVLLNEGNMMDIQALIHGPEGTPFEGGVFKIKFVIGSDFPSSPPKGFFTTKIFHPNVSKAGGEICVDTLKRDWKKDYRLEHILLVVRCLLIAPNPESALNEDAAKLLLDDYDAYFKHAKMWTGIHAPNRGEFAPVSRSSSPTASSATITEPSSTEKCIGNNRAECKEKDHSEANIEATTTVNAASPLGVNAHGNIGAATTTTNTTNTTTTTTSTTSKKRAADKKLEKDDKKRTLRRL
ncbi:hypothetical protein SeMB42_g00690 [Synchytrium endobioticum]|uniref:E2 ubiquitin-conjugating enzyme n=1 Tax=Synchytrium endobioticum TaxID=286115 RepID=A0A507DQT0_9FUNG|nr:hypothetical protein SeLEV6574_g02146 [Synchytrium endobioticum]TPX53585.1 hypothetical protein SeMB42_g00690 [Synchytrium endobioticum]